MSETLDPSADHSKKSSIKTIQENFELGPKLFPRDSFSISDRKMQFDENRKSPSHLPPRPDRTQGPDLGSKVSSVSKRLEDLRKKSSLDFHAAPVKDAPQKRENAEAVAWRDGSGSDDESLDSSDTDSDSERSIKVVTTTTSAAARAATTSPVTRAQVLSQAGLRVGFSSIPDQIYRKSLRKGFQFVILVLGESGLGKSTLINSLFLTDVLDSGGICYRPEKTTEIREHKVQLEEGGVRLSLTVVDTPGYGDRLDNSNCWEPALTYLHTQFDTWLAEETRVPRDTRLADTRVHACLYFISPNGHGLRTIDVETMRSLHRKVNIIPVIGKSDSCTREELDTFRLRIREQLEEADISVYRWGLTSDTEPDLPWPLAVVGSNTLMEDPLTGARVRARSYPWGCVNIEDQSHSDFTLLRRLLLCEHTQDLIDTTASVHYENYRFAKLSKLVATDPDLQSKNKNPLAAIEDEKVQHEEKMARMEAEMGAVLETKVGERRGLMAEVTRREEEAVTRDRGLVTRAREEIRDKRGELERERVEWTTRMRLSSARSTESLGKKKAFRLSMGTFKFGRQ